jgi:hypothetical protein
MYAYREGGQRNTWLEWRHINAAGVSSKQSNWGHIKLWLYNDGYPGQNKTSMMFHLTYTWYTYKKIAKDLPHLCSKGTFILLHNGSKP